MNQVEELIQKMCPNGVPYKQIRDIAETSIGLATSVTAFKSDSGVILLHNSDIQENRIVLKQREYVTEQFAMKNDKKVFKLHDLITVHTGDVGTTAVIEEEYVGSVGFTTITTRINDFKEINPYFLCYCLNSKVVKKQIAKVTISDRSNLNQKSFELLFVPVPPIEVQTEIVSILDSFQSIIWKLEKELSMRVDQYEFYRKEMLSTSNLPNSKQVKVKDIFSRLKGTPITAGKMKEIASDEGDITIYAGGETKVNAFESDIPNVKIVNVPAVLVQSRGLIDFIYVDKPFTFKNEMWAYTCKNKTTLKYLYYVFKDNIAFFRKASSGMGAMPQISLPVTEDFCFNLPSLEIQEKVVADLECFERMCKDDKHGLPAEITARRNQYKYYRDKLLALKELGN